MKLISKNHIAWYDVLLYKPAFIWILASVAAILRFYRIRDFLVFLGDEGRDVLVVKRMLIDHTFTLLGPITSVGGMYLGPLYYYFMAPFLWFFGYDPVGPAIMVAIAGVLSVIILYRIVAAYHSPLAGFISALLFALSPLVILYSRSSWNPNLVPFFTLIFIYSILRTNARHNRLPSIFSGLIFGILLQMHYIVLYLFFTWFIAVLIFKNIKVIATSFVYFLIGFSVSFSPFIVFELRHGFPNTQTIFKFVTKKGDDTTFSISNVVQHFPQLLQRISSEVLALHHSWLSIVTISFVFIGLLILVITKDYRKDSMNEQKKKFLITIGIWLMTGVVVMSLYQGTLYNYYFGSLFALPCIIIGIISAELLKIHRFFSIPVICIIGAIAGNMIIESPIRKEPNRLVDQTERIARTIVQKSENKPYNFALITAGNSDQAYRYYLELWGYEPQTIINSQDDPERRSVTEQLLIVCEDKVCHPLGHPLWEIAGFGRAEIAGTWEVFPLKVLRLTHYQEKSPPQL